MLSACINSEKHVEKEIERQEHENSKNLIATEPAMEPQYYVVLSTEIKVL